MKYRVQLFYPNETVSTVEVEAENAQHAADIAISENPSANRAKAEPGSAVESAWSATLRSANYDKDIRRENNEALNLALIMGFLP